MRIFHHFPEIELFRLVVPDGVHVVDPLSLILETHVVIGLMGHFADYGFLEFVLAEALAVQGRVLRLLNYCVALGIYCLAHLHKFRDVLVFVR